MKTIPSDTILLTDRLVLRKFTREDIPFVFSASRHPNFCDGMRWDPPDSMDELLKPFQNNEIAWDSGTAFVFTICGLDSGERIGRVALRNQNSDVWDIGFWTHPLSQNRRYMTEACRCILSVGFRDLHATEISATHATWNHSSRKVLHKIGMSFSHHIPNAFIKNDVEIHEDMLRITREVWEIQTEQGAAANP